MFRTWIGLACLLACLPAPMAGAHPIIPEQATTRSAWSLGGPTPGGLARMAHGSMLSGARTPQGADPAVLAVIPIGGEPTAAAVDPQLGRLYVSVLGPPIGPPPHPGYAPRRGPGAVRIFDGGTGRLLRTAAVGVDPSTVAVAERAGQIFVGNVGSVTILDATTGVVLRTLPGITIGSNPPTGRAIAVDERDNHVFLLSSAGLRMYAAPSDVLLATIPLGAQAGAVATDPATDHVFVAVAGPDAGTVIMLDGRSGRRLATTALPAGGLALPSTPCGIGIAAGRAIVVGTTGGRGGPRASILDTRTGALAATTDAGIESCDVVATQQGGDAVALTGAGYANPEAPAGITLANLATGVVRRSVAAAIQPSALAIDNRSGHVFLAGQGADRGGTVSVIDDRSGAVLRSIPTSAPPNALAVDEQAGHLFTVVPGRGSQPGGAVLMVDAGAGAPPGTLGVGQDPSMIAVDARTHRAFVIDQGGARSPGAGVPAPGDVSVVDTARGVLLRRTPVGLNPQAIAVDARAGRVLVVNAGYYRSSAAPQAPIGAGVSVLDAGSGAVISTLPFAYAVQAPMVVNGADHLAVLYATIPPVAPAYTQAFRLILLRVTSGFVLGATPPIEGVGRALAIDPVHRVIYVERGDCSPTCQNGIVAVDDRSGQLRRVIPLSTGDVVGMTVAGSAIFVLANGLAGHGPQGMAVALALPSGAPLWVRPVGESATGLASDAATHRLFATAYTPGTNTSYGYPTQPSTVAGIDALSGTQIFSTTVGHGAVDPLVDPGTGHLFVLNSTDNSVSMLDARSGRVLVTGPVGVQSLDLLSLRRPVMAIDHSAGRVVIVNGLSDSISIINDQTGGPQTATSAPTATHAGMG